MDDDVNVLHDVIKAVGDGEVTGDNGGEQIPVFFPASFHLISLGLGPRCCSNLDPTFEEEVYDVCAHKTCGACDKDMAKERFVRTCCI